tara:strand:- start:69 stop:1649 length:1581 start_codon:yes stop_codon:yes gene_type:complete
MSYLANKLLSASNLLLTFDQSNLTHWFELSDTAGKPTNSRQNNNLLDDLLWNQSGTGPFNFPFSTDHPWEVGATSREITVPSGGGMSYFDDYSDPTTDTWSPVPPITFAIWWKPDVHYAGFGSPERLLFAQDPYTYQTPVGGEHIAGWGIEVGDNGHIYVGYGNDSYATPRSEQVKIRKYDTPAALTVGNWHRIIVTIDSQLDVEVYIDKVRQTLIETRGTGSVVSGTKTPGDYRLPYLARYLTGKFVDHQVYNRVMLQKDVDLEYKQHPKIKATAFANHIPHYRLIEMENEGRDGTQQIPSQAWQANRTMDALNGIQTDINEPEVKGSNYALFDGVVGRKIYDSSVNWIHRCQEGGVWMLIRQDGLERDGDQVLYEFSRNSEDTFSRLIIEADGRLRYSLDEHLYTNSALSVRSTTATVPTDVDVLVGVMCDGTNWNLYIEGQGFVATTEFGKRGTIDQSTWWSIFLSGSSGRRENIGCTNSNNQRYKGRIYAYGITGDGANADWLDRLAAVYKNNLETFKSYIA